jgi:hypothetical protein
MVSKAARFTLKPSEVKKLVFHCQDLRERIIIRLMAHCEMRREEVCQVLSRSSGRGGGSQVEPEGITFLIPFPTPPGCLLRAPGVSFVVK